MDEPFFLYHQGCHVQASGFCGALKIERRPRGAFASKGSAPPSLQHLFQASFVCEIT